MRFTLEHANAIVNALAHLDVPADNFDNGRKCFQKISDFMEEAFPQQGNPTEWPLGSAVMMCDYLRTLKLPVPKLVNNLREPVEKLRILFNDILTDYSFRKYPSEKEAHLASASLDVLFHLVMIRTQRNRRHRLSA